MTKLGLVALMAMALSAAPAAEPGPVAAAKLSLTYYWLPG